MKTTSHILFLLLMLMFANHRLTAQGWAKVYEIYPALEDVKRIAYIDDTIFISSGSACHSGEECSFVTKLDTAGNILKTYELYKKGRGIQLGYLS